MRDWVAFLERHPGLKQSFEYDVMHQMSEIMAHTITLHLLDAPGRVKRFLRKHPELFDRIPKKELASYLNLSAETLSRLKQRGKISGFRVREAPRDGHQAQLVVHVAHAGHGAGDALGFAALLLVEDDAAAAPPCRRRLRR